MNRVENMETVQTLLAMKTEIERLQIEGDNLRAQLLQAPDAKMVAFMAAFELWLQSHILTEDDGDAYWIISPTEHSTHEDVRRQWRKLEAEYLDGSEEESKDDDITL